MFLFSLTKRSQGGDSVRVSDLESSLMLPNFRLPPVAGHQATWVRCHGEAWLSREAGEWPWPPVGLISAKRSFYHSRSLRATPSPAWEDHDRL